VGILTTRTRGIKKMQDLLNPLDPLIETIELFYSIYYQKEIEEFCINYPCSKSFFVDFRKIDRFNMEIAQQLLSEPDIILYAFREALRNKTGKEKVYIRITNNPNRIKVGEIRHEHIGSMVSVDGLVLKTTEVRPKLVTAAFQCPSCMHIIHIDQINPKRLLEPLNCESCRKKVTKFILLPDSSEFTDSQKIRIQESLEELRGGDMPATKDVELESDLAGVVSPGDRISINGILRVEIKTTSMGKSSVFDAFIEANSIDVIDRVFDEIKITDDDEHEILTMSRHPAIYEKLVSNIAPSIYGLKEIKEALMLQLFSGVPKNMFDGTTIRGDIHILLVGDPGLAKSQLLASAANIAPRGLFTSGSNSTAAGLTAAAIKDEFSEGAWSLEGGALVLADKGLCACDELDKMSKHDRGALHEALEQGRVSVAKAGIVATLHSRCAFLAAANPISGRFDPYEPIAKQVNMPPTLLSRFDLIFMMLDKSDEEKDTELAQFVLNTHRRCEAQIQNKEEKIKECITSSSMLRKYIAYSRKIIPQISNAAMQKFQNFYVGLRKEGMKENGAIPITIRQLESLVRLGEASARTRLSDVVTAEDADRVLNLFMFCMRSVFVDPESGHLDVDWVVSGTSKTKRDRATNIRNIVLELEDDFGVDIPSNAIIERACEEGIARDKVESILDLMKRDGIIFSPAFGIVRFVR
jgi:replicative DNA helicase Mcm